MNNRDIRWIMICIIIGLIGLFVGYSIGYTAGLNWSVGKAMWLLEIKGIDVGVNQAMITAGIMRYKHKVDALLPTLNESTK